MAPPHISPPEIRILTLSNEVTPFVSQVRQNADLEKDALGFLPAGVYDDAAKRDNLLVAVCGEKFAGHLLFGGRFPHARIFQLFVAPDFRGSGIGGRLVGRLIEVMEGYSFLSISARVAADLDANEFWNRMGFAIAGIKPGGPTRNRVINLRVKQLDRKEFDSYFSNATMAWAIFLEDICELPTAVTLATLRRHSELFHPPQFFKRLEDGSVALDLLLGTMRFPTPETTHFQPSPTPDFVSILPLVSPV